MWKRRLVWGAWILISALLYFFENNPGTRALLVASVLIPAASVLCAVLSTKRIALSLSVPETCKKGEETVCVVRTAGLLPGTQLCCCVNAVNRLTLETATLDLAVSAFGKQTAAAVATHCGTVSVSVENGRVQDLFGLWASGAISCDTEYLTVQPELFIPNVAFAESETFSADGERWSMQRPGTDPSETFSIREYLPGDPIRQIHWKLSQKNDTTMLRELGLPVAEETLLLLDTSASDDGLDAEAMDASMETILSLSNALVNGGISHSVGWKNRVLDELVLCEVRTEPEWSAMRDQLLCAASGLDEESICGCFRKWHSGNMYAHTVVCAPTIPADISSLCDGNRVTLLLSRGDCVDGACGGVIVRAYDPAGERQELNDLEI